MKREIVKTLTQTYPNCRKKLVLQVYNQAEGRKQLLISAKPREPTE